MRLGGRGEQAVTVFLLSNVLVSGIHSTIVPKRLFDLELAPVVPRVKFCMIN